MYIQMIINKENFLVCYEFLIHWVNECCMVSSIIYIYIYISFVTITFSLYGISRFSIYYAVR